MPDNLVKNGLPRWIYTWKAVAAIFFGGPIIVLLAGSAMSMVSAMLDPRDPNWAPSCHLTNRDPIAPGSRKFEKRSNDVTRAERERREAIAKFHKAAAACSVDSCPSGERTEFRNAAIGYIRERATTAEQMLLRHGEEGRSSPAFSTERTLIAMSSTSCVSAMGQAISTFQGVPANPPRACCCSSRAASSCLAGQANGLPTRLNLP